MPLLKVPKKFFCSSLSNFFNSFFNSSSPFFLSFIIFSNNFFTKFFLSFSIFFFFCKFSLFSQFLLNHSSYGISLLFLLLFIISGVKYKYLFAILFLDTSLLLSQFLLNHFSYSEIFLLLLFAIFFINILKKFFSKNIFSEFFCGLSSSFSFLISFFIYLFLGDINCLIFCFSFSFLSFSLFSFSSFSFFAFSSLSFFSFSLFSFSSLLLIMGSFFWL